ncbi:hypothetical protein EYF80_007338 [Liparis tanakae]|uniref:Uncharacterized protein n=1 Tax=Liparis tanakae TaxID=230148 RepID=A0A4Z2IZ82_9TELE|nr:hypothetical protein EYF80_007338 [Liparis tanakae]
MGEGGREAGLKASDICSALRCHLVYRFDSESVTSGVEEMELISEAEAPPVGLFIKDRLSMQSSFTLTVTKIKLDDPSEVKSLRPAAVSSLIHSPHPRVFKRTQIATFQGISRCC